MDFNLRGLLQDEEFLIAAGLLSAGSQGQSIGQAAFPSILQAGQVKKAFGTKQRKTIKGADGYQYYVDTGERVLPDVVKEKTFLTTKNVYDNVLDKNVLANNKQVAENPERYGVEKKLDDDVITIYDTKIKKNRLVYENEARTGIKDGTYLPERKEDKPTQDMIMAAKVYGKDTPAYHNYLNQKMMSGLDARTTLMKNAEELHGKGTDKYYNYISDKLKFDVSDPVIRKLTAAGIEPGSIEWKEAIIASIAKTDAGFKSASPLESEGKIDNAKISADYSLSGANKIIKIAELTKNSPEIFGTKGAVLSLGSKIQKELQGLFSNDLTEYGVLDDDSVSFLANQDFSKLDALSNSLSINLARMRNPTGRLMKDMILDSKKDTNFKGLGGVQFTKEKLPTLFNEFISNARVQLQNYGMPKEQINAILERKEKEFYKALGFNLETTNKIKQSIPRYKLIDGKLVLQEDE